MYDPECQFTDVPPASYPAKLTQFMYRRYQTFADQAGKGFVILPCELIDNNGQELKNCVLKYAKQWNLEQSFIDWIEAENIFCSTLVDRIVTGYPRSEAQAINEANGYEDNIIDTGEVFGFWVIEGPESLKKELPFDKAGLPVLITDDHKPYKQRKVRILNGAHTSMVLGAYLAGQDIVRNCMEDDTILNFMNKTIYDEIIPTLSLPEEECRDFAAAVTERFKNPFIDHALLSISLNSTSKWRARVIPSLEGYVDKFGKLPSCITASFAFYIAFYCGSELTDKGLIATRPNGDTYTISDDRSVLEFYLNHKDAPAETLVHDVCANTDFWGKDLTEIPGFEQAVTDILKKIKAEGTLCVHAGLPQIIQYKQKPQSGYTPNVKGGCLGIHPIFCALYRPDSICRNAALFWRYRLLFHGLPTDDTDRFPLPAARSSTTPSPLSSAPLFHPPVQFDWTA